MNREEFIRKWNLQQGLRVILFNGGSIFADYMTIQYVRKITRKKSEEYYEGVFSKNVGSLVETGTCRIDKIKEVL